MNQPRKIVTNTISLASARIMERGSTLCLSFLIARSLGASGLGIYSAAMVFYGLISVAAELGTTTYIVREVAKDTAQTSRYLVHLSVLTLLGSAIVMTGAWFVLPHLGYSPELTASVRVLIIAVVAGTLRTVQEAVFVAHQRITFIVGTTLIAVVCNVGATFYLLGLGHGIVSLITAFAIIQYAVSTSYILLIHRFIAPLRWEFEPRFAVHLLKEIRVFAGSSILGCLFVRPEIIILSILKTDAQIGLYSAALRIVGLWELLPETYMTSVFPVLSRSYSNKENEKTQLVLGKSLKYLLAISIPLCVGLFIAAKPIIELIYGPGFDQSVTLLRILAICVPLESFLAVSWRWLAATNQQHLLLRAQVVTITIRMLSGVALISWLASTGAAISTTLVILIHTFLLAYYVRRDGTRSRVLGNSWRLVLAALAMGALTALIVDRMSIWIVVPVAAALYSVGVIAVRAFSSDDFELFRKVLKLHSAESD